MSRETESMSKELVGFTRIYSDERKNDGPLLRQKHYGGHAWFRMGNEPKSRKNPEDVGISGIAARSSTSQRWSGDGGMYPSKAATPATTA